MTLDELVTQYGQNDEELKKLKKVCDGEKEEIKTRLSTEGVSDWTAGGYEVKRIESERTTLNEVQLLSILKQDWMDRYGDIPCPYIKTTEYVDMDELESVLYAGELPADVVQKMDGCRETTTVVTLRCSKAKQKKGEE